MSSTQFHPSTEKRLKMLENDLPQSLLITGPFGVGLSAIYTHLSARLGIVAQVVLPERDDKIDVQKGTVSVDVIRRLYDMTKTIESNKRLVVIDYAERMGSQAQNAFLKLLEEPGLNTHFILLSHEPSKLLPTIHSRVQAFDVRPITAAQSESLIDELGMKDAKKRSQLLFMAEGLPAELTKLATDEDYFADRAQIVRDARQFLQGTSYERLKLAQAYKDDREIALLLISDALKMLQHNIEGGKAQLLPKINELLTSYDRIATNGNVRLQLSAAMV